MSIPAESTTPSPLDPYDNAIAALSAHRWFVISALVSILAFVWVATGGTGDLLEPEPFADFYDYQAASLLQGRLDVPPEALSFEAFIYKGKAYGYFGLTPALLRLPFAIIGFGFGHLSRLYATAYFAGALTAAYLIFLHARRYCGAGAAPPHPWVVVLLVANAGVANTLFLLGSRAYVYHEAILCGVAFALWSVWCALRHLAAPAGRWWLAAVILGILAVHGRPPAGLFALSVTGVVAATTLLQRWRDQGAVSWATVRGPLLIGTLAVLGVLSFNGVSYLKFETFNACPLQYHVQYQPQMDPGRLARFEGKQFHLTNLPLNFYTYVLRPGLSVSRYFPYVAMAGEPPREEFPRAKMDWIEPTVAFPYAMPSLFALATIGSIAVFITRWPARQVIAVLWIGAVPMCLAMFTAVALSHRYTADFCPPMICVAAFALAAMETAAPLWRRVVASAAAVLTVVGVLTTLLLTLGYQGERLWGVSERVRSNYAALRQRIDRVFGVTNPAGYVHDAPLTRRVDDAFQTWVVSAYLLKPATVPRAVAVYEKYLQNQFWFADVHASIGEVYVQQKDLARATRAWERAVAAEPRKPQWQARLGELLAAQERTAEAIEHYQIALQLDPKFVLAHNNLGAAYAKVGRMQEALLQIETALQLDPNFAPALDNIKKLKSALGPPP